MSESWETPALVSLYLLPFLGLVLWQTSRRRQINRSNKAQIDENKASGLTQPASLHPVIDKNLCIGCNSCVAACPEGNVLGIVDDKAELVNPTSCIGHGACARACPMGGIRLVFGSAERGVDIPLLSENFESNVPGIFLVGEVGGMGLIRNAMEQGKRAIDYIRNIINKSDRKSLDVLIVGAGPAGISASIAAKYYGLRYRTIEQQSFGGTVAHYPRGKLVMTQPVDLPGIGKIRIGEIKKEDLLSIWEDLKSRANIEIHYQESFVSLEKDGANYRITTTAGEFVCKTLVFAIGRRGTPRKLEVPGESDSKVVYSLVDPAQYRGQKVLVVGGGDSALEAAIALAEEANTTVTLSYRGDAFNRAKLKNRDRLKKHVDKGRIRLLLSSVVESIHSDKVTIKLKEELLTLENDAILVSVGGILPTKMLTDLGIEIETKFGTA
ncbi:MAG: NAD(P)-binding domain-containing protein [Gammaproteobacteria bacterium]|nr:NAD(P)-binding domain-containing protein [Gammaproteobacteria bacterium]